MRGRAILCSMFLASLPLQVRFPDDSAGKLESPPLAQRLHFERSGSLRI